MPEPTTGLSTPTSSKHLLDRLNAGDRLLRERKAESNRADQLSLYVDWAPAHPLDDAGLSQRAAAESSEDDALPWAGILENTEDFDLELFDMVPLEDSPANAVHPGSDIFEGEEILSIRHGSGLEQQKTEYRSQPDTTTYGLDLLTELTPVSHCCSSWT